MKNRLLSMIFVATVSAVALTGCADNSTKEATTQESSVKDTLKEEQKNVSYPITMKHAYGETVITEEPQNIVTLGWGNQDTVLALGKVPVGVSAANYGYVTKNQLHDWTDRAFQELGVNNPNVFHDTDGFDYEAISDANPDVILAAYSGMTQEEYDMLSSIAPVLPFEKTAWKTSWRESTLRNSEAMGMKEEGEAKVAEVENLIQEKVKNHKEFKDINAGFFWISPDDFSSFYAYLTADPRAAYLTDLGFKLPESIARLSKDSEQFTVALSRENVADFSDIDVMVLYGDEALLKALQEDALMSQIPAIKNGAVVLVDSASKLAAATTPTVLSIPATIDEYIEKLADASGKIDEK